MTIFDPLEKPLEVPQGYSISRPQGRNSKIASIAPVGSPIQQIEQNIGPLQPVVLAGRICGSKMSLSIL